MLHGEKSLGGPDVRRFTRDPLLLVNFEHLVFTLTPSSQTFLSICQPHAAVLSQTWRVTVRDVRGKPGLMAKLWIEDFADRLRKEESDLDTV